MATTEADNSQLLGEIRQWQYYERNCRKRGRHFFVTGLLKGHKTIPDGKFFTLYLPSPVVPSQQQSGQTLRGRSGHIFKLGERRNRTLESLQSHYLEKSSGEEPRKPTWKPTPRSGQS